MGNYRERDRMNLSIRESQRARGVAGKTLTDHNAYTIIYRDYGRE